MKPKTKIDKIKVLDVVGIIFMVAITVILAGAIAGWVNGYGIDKYQYFQILPEDTP